MAPAVLILSEDPELAVMVRLTAAVLGMKATWARTPGEALAAQLVGGHLAVVVDGAVDEDLSPGLARLLAPDPARVEAGVIGLAHDQGGVAAFRHAGIQRIVAY